MEADPDLRRTIEAMDLLESWIPDFLKSLDPDIADRFNNALLNIVVHRLIEEEGHAAVATILWRLAETVATGQEQHPSAPVELTKLDG